MVLSPDDNERTLQQQETTTLYVSRDSCSKMEGTIIVDKIPGDPANWASRFSKLWRSPRYSRQNMTESPHSFPLSRKRLASGLDHPV